MNQLTRAVALALPDVPVVQSFVSVQEPRLDAALAGLTSPAVVVPLLLCSGFHLLVDVAKAVDRHPGTVSTGALGPDPALTDLLQRRLTEAGATPDDAVVLGIAGSSDPSGAVDAEAALALFTRSASSWPDARLGYVAAKPRLTDVVSEVRASNPGRRVVIASYLMTPGFFLDHLRRAGADLVTSPLGADSALVDLVVRRYRGSLRD